MTRRGGQSGFTLVEMILAITLLAAIAATAYSCLTIATRAWRAGVETADRINICGYELDNIVAGLASAYYPETVPKDVSAGEYGMQLVNDGDGEDAGDSLMWVKLGPAIVGNDSSVANTPHKVSLYRVKKGESDVEGLEEGGLVVKAWRLTALPDEFDPSDEDFVPPMLLVPGVTGFDVRVLNPKDNLESGKLPEAEEDSGLELDDEEKWWDDDWTDDYTNHLPYQVQVTLYLEPQEERGEPIAVRRIATLRTAPLSWSGKFKRGGQSNSNSGNGKSPSKNPNQQRTPNSQTSHVAPGNVRTNGRAVDK